MDSHKKDDTVEDEARFLLTLAARLYADNRSWSMKKYVADLHVELQRARDVVRNGRGLD